MKKVTFITLFLLLFVTIGFAQNSYKKNYDEGSNTLKENTKSLIYFVRLSEPDNYCEYEIGSTQQIRWTSQSVNYVKIEYTTNDGVSWALIADSVDANLESITWVVPNTPSPRCRVKISDVANRNVKDFSIALFVIFYPEIKLIRPNGNERFGYGKTETITWDANYLKRVSLYYSSDMGNSWSLIEKEIDATTKKYDWLIPNILSDQCLVKIVNEGIHKVDDVSDSAFTIFKKYVGISYINGSDTVRAGSFRYILWNMHRVDTVKIEYSSDDGATWSTLIDKYTTKFNNYKWDVPKTTTMKGKLKISDANEPGIFEIYPHTIKVVNANLAFVKEKIRQNYRPENQLSVTWSTDYVQRITIQKSLDDGKTWITFVRNYDARKQEYKWYDMNVVKNNYLVRIVDVIDTNLCDTISLNIEEYPYSIELNKIISFGDWENKRLLKLISIPGDVNSRLSDYMVGTPNTDWIAYDEYGLKESELLEFDINNSDAFRFQPGKSYWAKNKSDFCVFGNINNVNIEYSGDGYYILLRSGWNLIANPFIKGVYWDDVVEANNLNKGEHKLFSWNKHWEPYTTVMIPFEGYYYYNVENKQHLFIPYNLRNIENTEPEKPVASGQVFANFNLHYGDWKYGSAELSIDQTSLEDYDKKDITALPSDFEIAGVRFYESKSNLEKKEFFKDSKPIVDDFQIFQMHTINESGLDLDLDWTIHLESTAKYEIYLHDSGNNMLYNMKEVKGIRIPENCSEYQYKVIVGTKEYIESFKKSLVPTEFELYQNYPNPFNAGTVIRYSLPYDSHVNISIYNVIGQKIMDVVSSTFEAGYHEQRVEINNFASGVYLYRIEAKAVNSGASFSTTKKMILLK